MSDAIQRLRDWRAQTAIILGSGLSSIVPDTAGDQGIAYAEFPDIPKPSVPGHTGRFVFGKVGDTPIVFAQGRVHLYEGHSARAVTAGVRLLAESGVKTLIVTNAAGSLNSKFTPGSWMMLTDHLNLSGTSPLTRTSRRDVEDATAHPAWQPQFIDMTSAYSPRLRERFSAGASKAGVTLHEGVYAALLGPQYETPAEIRMLQKLGADAVGMSTVPEVIQARALGLEVAGFSCITNFAAGISKAELSHEEVLEIGKGAAKDFGKLLNATFASL